MFWKCQHFLCCLIHYVFCLAVTALDADRYCQSLFDQINSAGSNLYNALRPIKTNPSSSNDALFGCLALLAIPVLILIGIVCYLWYAD